MNHVAGGFKRLFFPKDGWLSVANLTGGSHASLKQASCG